MNDAKSNISWFPNTELELDIENIPVHVLIADDDPAIRNLLCKILKNYGYRVTVVEDGASAWKALTNKDDLPELAILDWMMPGLTGLELCARLKKRKHPFVFTILLTALSNDDNIVSGLNAGAHEFLIKPFSLHVLEARVAAGARIVRLEKELTMKNKILKNYAQKLEKNF